MIKAIIESSPEQLNTYKISFLFNEPLKSYRSLYLATFSVKSISHTFAKLVTTQAKLIELVFESIYKDFYKTFRKIYLKSDGLFDFKPFLANFHGNHKYYGNH